MSKDWATSSRWQLLQSTTSFCRGVNTEILMDNPIRLKIGTKRGIEKILGILSFEDLNIGVKLGLNHRMKIFKQLTSF